MSELQTGRILQKIRKSRGLSLEELSELTSVSKPMLGQIERGKSVPTITTLWKIATGLKMPLSSFLETHLNTYELASPEPSACITEENGKMTAWPLFRFDPLHNVETFLIELNPNCQHFSSGHEPGVEEHVFVLDGELTMEIGEERITVSKHQVLRFQADQIHGYLNHGSGKCIFYNTIFYSNRLEMGRIPNV